MKFIDEAIITIRSGKGGNGCIAFRREKFAAFGGPNGGNGGKGGDVYLRGNKALHSLQDVRLQRIYEAENGKSGLGSQCDGKSGNDCIIDVPLGTMVLQIVEGREDFVADVLEDKQIIILAQGGRGGKGNEHFKSSTMRTPRFAQKGELGEEKKLRLELKILADIGIVGLPNAGKSTLISVLSAARPTIAPYPFTTITPNLGVLIDEYDPDRRIVIADIPGLIEGASAGIGLGSTFLKHVERTRFLLHLLSAEDINEDDPFAGFRLVDDEIALFNADLLQRKQVKVINKIDILSPEQLTEIQAKATKEGLHLHYISAKENIGIEELTATLWALYDELERNTAYISYKEHTKREVEDSCDESENSNENWETEVIWLKE